MNGSYSLDGLYLLFYYCYLDVLLPPSGAIIIPHKVYPTYSITEPLGTIHRYRMKPIIVDDKRLELYCFVHGYPEIIIKLRTGKWRVRQWK